jgi:hypothetical protein
MTFIKTLMSYYEDNYTPEDACHRETKIASRKDTLTAMRKENNENYHTVKLRYNNKWKGHYLSSITISYYRTLVQSGSRIIHAITGEQLPGVVGSLDENRYFKVKVSSFGQENNGNLFYLSPEEYENHQFCCVGQATRDKWRAKQLIC